MTVTRQSGAVVRPRGLASYILLRCATAIIALAWLIADRQARADTEPTPMLVPPWGPRIQELMTQYRSCDAAGNEKSPTACNVFLARALRIVYGVTDFADPSRPAGYINANAIADALLISKDWKQLGSAADPAVLAAAADLANHHVAVVAVWKNPDPKGHGHVALILPGALTTTSWGSTPNSASFFLNKPINESYIGLPLSRAFKKELRPDVLLYRRVLQPE